MAPAVVRDPGQIGSLTTLINCVCRRADRAGVSILDQQLLDRTGRLKRPSRHRPEAL
ncbi:hypothetical protein ABT040_06235 [Streptomyces sp. NPDC002688]|uniref:hypothetical protein n=1 Tax=Streptomyces sp. NPDC002688 TaxID=3154423 RepID=UPI003320F27F